MTKDYPKDKPNSSPKAKIFVSTPLKLDIKKLDKKFSRADLEFHGVDHSGPSYEGRVFINNREADERTPKTLREGYVGSYHIFGHGGCFGDVGHCDIKKERLPYDYRPSHPLTPALKRITITDKIETIGKRTDELVITIVPVLAGGSEITIDEVVKLERISIAIYDK